MRKKFIILVLCIISCSIFVFSACNMTTLPSPNNLSIDIIEDLLSWEAVPNSSEYEVEITLATTKTTTFTKNAWLKLDENVNDLVVNSIGNKFRVRAITGDKNYYHSSEWSDYIVYQGNKVAGFEFFLINDETEYMLRKGDGDAVIIPDTYNSRPITAIGDNAFLNSGITSVVFGKNIKNVGNFAFNNCLNLTQVTLNDGLRILGNNVFNLCSKLEAIEIPDSVVQIGNNAFANTAITEAKIGTGLNQIPSAMFYNCRQLSSITLSDNITSIMYNAFGNCTSLESVELGNSVQTIGQYAFSSCIFPEITLPSSLLGIGQYAFAGNDFITRISFPDGLTTLGYGAFYSCTNLSEISELPSSLTTLDGFVFEGTAFWNNFENDVVVLGDWVVGWRQTEEAIPVEVVLPTGVKKLANYAFFKVFNNQLKGEEAEKPTNFSNLSKITLNEGLEYIGLAAFYRCRLLTEITIPDSVVTITNSAFLSSGIEKVEMGSGVRYVGSETFDYTPLWFGTDGLIIYADGWVVGTKDGEPLDGRRLDELTTEEQESVVKFELKEVKLERSTVGICDSAFRGAESLANVVLNTGLKYIGHYAFAYSKALTSVGTVPGTVVQMGEGVFLHCESLQAATLSSDIALDKLPNQTFYRCYSLEYVIIPDSIQVIGEEAFYECELLANIDWGFSLTTIEDNAFFGCFSLSSLDIPEGVTSIGNHTFRLCTGLMNITFPSTLEFIGEHAFRECRVLDNVVFPDNITKISNYLFRDCAYLTTITIPSSVTTIGFEAFRGCDSFRTFDLPASITTIEDYAFADCLGMYYISIPETVESVGNYAFFDCKNLYSVFLGDGIEKIGKHPFYGSNLLTIYSASSSQGSDWDRFWNYYSRPVIWGVQLTADYPSRFTKTADSLTNFSKEMDITVPFRHGFLFDGWATTENGTPLYKTMESLIDAPNNTNLYSIWTALERKTYIIDYVGTAEFDKMRIESLIIYDFMLYDLINTPVEGYNVYGLYLDEECTQPFAIPYYSDSTLSTIEVYALVMTEEEYFVWLAERAEAERKANEEAEQD